MALSAPKPLEAPVSATLGMVALAVSYAAELARFGIETTIIVPGSFTSGTNHFAHSGHPADEQVVADYDDDFAADRCRPRVCADRRRRRPRGSS